MSAIRFWTGFIVSVALGLGYLASQWAYFSGRAAEYSARVDVPTIQWLALAVLALVVGLGFLKGGDPA